LPGGSEAPGSGGKQRSGGEVLPQRRQPFRHPVAGDPILDYDALEIPADPGLTIIA